LRERRGLVVITGSILAVPLFVALYAWLVSASNLPISTSADVIVTPPSGYLADNKVSISSARKYAASSNDAEGHYGLAEAPGFAFNEAVPGWATPGEADKVLGLAKGTTRKALADQGLTALKPKSMDIIFNGTLATVRADLAWSAEDKDDGVFMRKDPATSDIIFQDVTHARLQMTGQGKVGPGGGQVTFVHGKDVRDQTGQQLAWDTFVVSPDLSHVMFFSDTMRVYRYSKKSNIWIHNVKEKRTWPLGDGPLKPPAIAHAAWIPSTSSSLAYVQDNNLYVALDPDRGQPIRITSDGTATIFNAVTDWVYEEEVFESNHALWFSPGGSKLAYLRFDETDVPVYDFPIYNPDPTTAGATTPYLNSVKLKYPKPGFKNPIVSAHLLDLKKLAELSAQSASIDIVAAKYELNSPLVVSGVSKEQKVDEALFAAEDAKDKLVTEVAWLDDDSLFIRETDRGSDHMRGILFDTSKVGEGKEMVGRVVRRVDATDKSWVPYNQDIVALGVRDLAAKSTAYLDIIENGDGFKHLAFYPNATSPEPIFLTFGAWEVDKLLHADIKRNRAYISAAYPLPYHRHIFIVDLPDIKAGSNALRSFRPHFKDINAAHPDKSFDASFDPKGAYYLLRELGPRVPTARVIGVDDASFEWVIEDNAAAVKTAAQYTKAHHIYYNVTLPNGVTTSVKEIRPYDFDASGETRYPVLLNVYGGPDSQQVTHNYSPQEWHESLVNQLGYVVAIVDGRGTGYRGAAYRDGVAKQLGSIEVDDLLATADKIRRLPYVDEKRLGLWGWSYGGYFTNKVLERDAGLITLGMSVAPVTKWTFYDSIYTERYMKTLDSNRAGYEKSDVHVTDGFKQAHFLLAQGSGDENVHFENSAHLLDLLTAKQVRGFWFRMFTDSAHGISTRGAYRELHEYLTDFLKTKWGAGGKRKFGGKGGRKGLVAEHVQRRSEGSEVEEDEWLVRRDELVEEKRIERQAQDEALVRRLARRVRRGEDL
jgi:dipeptidyl aminopeptidase